MKKQNVTWLGITAVLTLFLAACGASSATPEPSTATAVPEPVTSGPRTGEEAPDFTLSDHAGNPVHLADELQDNRAVALVFYDSYQ